MRTIRNIIAGLSALIIVSFVHIKSNPPQITIQSPIKAVAAKKAVEPPKAVEAPVEAPKTPEQQAFAFYISKGLTRVQTAAIIGNFIRESSMVADREEVGNAIGYGIGQWSFGRRIRLVEYAASQSKPASDLQLQLDYSWHELTGSEHKALADLQQHSDLSAATASFMYFYERPGVKALDDRIHFAHQVLSRN